MSECVAICFFFRDAPCKMQPARILSISSPVNQDTDSGPTNPEEMIAYCARVSNPANQWNNATSPRLLAYLKRNGHWSPFEMVHVNMEINTTRDVARQILRHRSFSFQEFSQRYAAVDCGSCHVHEARMQDRNNRQASIPTDDEALQEEWKQRQERVWQAATEAYGWAIENGIAKEVARAVMPEGLTHSRLYMSGTVRSWIHYLRSRCDPSTQREHRLVAEACRQCLQVHFPTLFS